MILIVSHNDIDMPSDLVFSWLQYLGANCHRLNGIDLLQKSSSIRISNSDSCNREDLVLKEFDITKTKAVWMRRWIAAEYFNGLDDKIDTSDLADLLGKEASPSNFEGNSLSVIEMTSLIKKELISQRRNEFKSYSQFFFELLKDVPTLGFPFYSSKDPSKAHQIKVAREIGMKIPDTIITNSKKELQEFSADYPQIVCKNVSEISAIYYYRLFMTYTSVICREFIEQLPDHFYVALFQEAIEKEFEVRVFYLDGKLFSMAIFSNKDPQTKTDFRIYNAEKPNRTVPIRLPDDLEDKIVLFMNRVNLSTGSLDLIYSTTGEYYFLEVNPVGQFGMVSYPCNYNLEKVVAEHLIKISTNERHKRN